MLETFLSGASFTDMLAEMSTQLDAPSRTGRSRRRSPQDRETLLAPPPDGRSRPATRRTTCASRPRSRSRSSTSGSTTSRRPRRGCTQLEKAAKAALAAQKAQYAQMAASKAAVKRALATAARAKHSSQNKIKHLVAAPVQPGQHPVALQRDARWPMGGDGDPAVRLHRRRVGAALRAAAPHFHNGIDIVAPYGTAVHASGARAGRLHRLELRGRRRPGVDRDHRPLLEPHHLVRTHAAALPGRAPARSCRRAR